MADRFYTTQPLTIGDFVLDGPEAHHLGTVRRFEPGDQVTLFNGDGAEYPSSIVSVGKKQVVLNITARLEVDRERRRQIIVASALPKGDRAEFMIEKLTELGVAEFVPLLTTRSVVVPKENSREKFERMVIEAAKQCGRNRLMTVSPARKYEEFVTQAPHPAYLLTTSDAATPTQPDAASACFLIGPEGGFTADEIALAVSHGVAPLHLGPRILRIETAAQAATMWAGWD
jgi:16S rRNA (uracil1498-N3)-methyltransferase